VNGRFLRKQCADVLAERRVASGGCPRRREPGGAGDPLRSDAERGTHGERVGACRQHACRRETEHELVEHSRLADARVARDDDDASYAFFRALVECRLESAKLAIAADAWCGATEQLARRLGRWTLAVQPPEAALLP